jgi:4-aminobutyrate aminotransferase-like enzyme
VSLSAVISRADAMNHYAQGAKTTLHSASPVAAAAGLAGAFTEVLG